MIQWHYPIWLYGALILLSLTLCDTNTISTVWLYDIKHEPLHCLYDTPTLHCVTLYTLWLYDTLTKHSLTVCDTYTTLSYCTIHVHYKFSAWLYATLTLHCLTLWYMDTTLFECMIHLYSLNYSLTLLFDYIIH